MKYLPYLLIALVAGVLWFQNQQLVTLSGDLRVAQDKVKTLTDNQKKIQTDLKNYETERIGYNTRIEDLESGNRVKKSKLDQMKGRESTLGARPELTEKMINDSFRKSADELSCSTGASERCVK